MRIIIIIGFLLCFAGGCQDGTTVAPRQKTEPVVEPVRDYKKEMDEIRKNVKAEVKIKLKKDAKGIYSWEISGKDAQEILKTNEILRKRLDQ